MTKKAGVIGYPITHSLSPIIHNYWLEKYNIDGEYKAIEVHPDNLKTFIKSMNNNGYNGCNVTIPHKEQVFELVGENKSDSAKNIGAVNTVVIDGDNISGDNTDWMGFTKNILQSKKSFNTKKAVMLGAGGAARAILYALLVELKFEQVIVSNRSIKRAENLKSEFEKLGFINKITVTEWDNKDSALTDADFLVNTTSLGMVDQNDLQIDLSKLPITALVTDIVFNPLITPLLDQAWERSNPIVDGLGMLLHQAAPGFKAWFGRVGTVSGLPEVDEELRQRVMAGF
jgi:shikimate dehydrogenase